MTTLAIIFIIIGWLATGVSTTYWAHKCDYYIDVGQLTLFLIFGPVATVILMLINLCSSNFWNKKVF